MKTIKIVTAFLLVLVFSTRTIAQQAETKEQLVVPLTEPGKPYKLDVGLISGSIKIVVYEGKDLIIDAVTDTEKKKEKERDKSDAKENTAGMKRIAVGNGLDISAEEKNNHVTVHSNTWKAPVNLTIKVPQAAATLKLSTINNGEITVNNVNGELEVSNTNGPIHLNNVSGSAVANSVNGSIVVTFKSIDAKAAMAFSTLNGKLDVSFPASFKANVKLKSDHGEMYTDFDIDADKTQPKADRTSQGGMYRVNIENWVYGKINGGGPELMMKNMNGNIYIRKTK